MNYRAVVLAVRLNRSRLVLVLESDIYIYDIANMKLIHVINSTPKNKDGMAVERVKRGKAKRSINKEREQTCRKRDLYKAL